ncbi:MAG: hypothetical protein R3178_00915 [Rhodothermales bacterium]|nr:hypothetical protein [Rhodothermales bacterium]
MKRRGYVPLWAAVACGILVSNVSPVSAQSVVDIYQRQFFRKQALAKILESGEHVSPRPPRALAAPLDSILLRFEEPPVPVVEAPRPAVTIRHVQRIPKLARNYFQSLYKEEQWVFVGANSLAALDTMMTREIRARLEAHYGKPTRTIVDGDPVEAAAAGDIFQFEYWFVLDREIPLVVTDVNGPFERGVAVSTTAAFADDLIDLRDALLAPILESDRRGPFVDYYYDDEAMQWYRTGYDGTEFFVDPVTAPGLNRPVIRPRSEKAMPDRG